MKKIFEKIGFLFMVAATALAFTACESESENAFTDARDGKTYKTVKINNDVWMAENLNFETADSKCYRDNLENCAGFGRLYTWKDALKACPEGWRLPDYDKMNALRNFASCDELKSSRGWAKDGNGTDKYGFNILPAGGFLSRNGSVQDAVFYAKGEGAYFWTSTKGTFNRASYFVFSDGVTGLGYEYPQEFLLSVRCVKK